MKDLIQILIVFFVSTVIISCNQKKEYPKELEYCFEYLNDNWDPQEIEIFKNITKEDTTSRNYHFGIGLHLRNYLIRNHPYSDSIQSYFTRNGVDHYDNMSGIILSSYHKYLNNEKLELDEYYAEMKIYQREQQECQVRLDSLSQVYDNEYLIGDTLSIHAPMRDSIHIIYADCYDWEYAYENDLKIIGSVIQKEYSEDNKLFSFDIRLIEQSKLDVEIYSRAWQTGDTLPIWTNSSWKLNKYKQLLQTKPKLH